MNTFLKQAPVTVLIGVACIVAWLVTAAQSHSLSNSYYESRLAADWTLWGPTFHAQPLTAVEAGFMHVSAAHLVVNMVTLFFIGREVERALGPALYAAAYLVSVVGSSASVLWMDYHAPTVGASGALFALMALLIGVYRSRGMDLRAPIIFIAANVAYSFMVSNVSLWGHLGGLCAGLALLPFVFAKRPLVRWLGIGVILALVGVLLALRAGVWG